jgi:hypothetical protein
MGECALTVVGGSCEETAAAKGDTVSATGLDLGEEGMSPEFADQAADALTATTGFLGICGCGAPEQRLQVVVGETVDEVSAGEDSLEEVGVGTCHGVEA